MFDDNLLLLFKNSINYFRIIKKVKIDYIFNEKKIYNLKIS
jgi:hypothetical protein